MMKQIQLLIWILFVSLYSRGEAVNGYRPHPCVGLFSLEIEESCETLDSACYTTTQNYVVETVYLDPTSSNPSARSVYNITYLDGFGRKLQEIQVHGSPDGRSDIVLPYRYGVQGRVEKEYLPYALIDNHGSHVTDAFNSLKWKDHGIMESRYTYTLTGYDNSPLDRVIKQTGPGRYWHEKKKGVTTSYGMNGTNEVKLYRVSATGALTLSGYYAVGSLEKVTVTDEDGKRVETFTDNGGVTVLVVQVENASNRLETYSVYDDRGLLRHVLSPEASAQLGTTINETILQRLAYRYDYDRWGRMIQKRLPGCDPVYLVYDKRDRLVMSQDGKQRAEHANKWSYSLYDNQNRVTETGEVVVTGSVTSHAGLQLDASVTDNHVPTGTRSPLQYTLYDNYTATAKVPVLSFQAVTGYTAGYYPHVTGLVTSVRTRVLGATPEKWLTTTTYYDDHCRVIQSANENLLGGISRVDMKLDFVGNVVQHRESHQAGSVTDVLESVNVHDDRGRLLSSVVKLNGGSPATTILGYDRVGRLISRKLGAVTDTMTYNPRGWLTGKASKAFRMQLRYEVPQGGADTCYNGNVSEWEWQQGTNTALMYGFTYDGVNRLRETVQKQKNGTTWTTLAGNYVEKGITYDRNGNIKTLQRTAGGTTVDDLVYDYTGNQLTGLTENVRKSLAGDVYSPGTIVTGAYSYDKNGNMVNDSRRVLNFSYNVLNLLGEVKTTTGTLKAKYFYLADGTKLRVRDRLEESGSSGFDYLGSLTYRRNGTGLQLECASFGDGVIRVAGSNSAQSEVNYFLTDHLGSVRVIVDGSGTVKERNDYYPFGTRHLRGDYPQLAANRYKYNGKEEQVTGNLDFLDHGARMYDSGLGRWFGMDPMAENYLNQSPYHFCGNNPIVFMDPNGMDYWTTSDPGEIARFFSILKGENSNLLETFDYSDWARFKDSEVLDLLTLNDETKKLYSSYGTIIDGVATRVGVSLNVNALFNLNAFVTSRREVFDRAKKLEWYRKSSGRAEQDYTVDMMFVPVAKGLGLGVSVLGKFLGKGAGVVVNRGVKLLQRFNSVESLVENAGKLQRLKGGIKQGFIQGNAEDIFKGLAQQYGAKIQTNGIEMFFESGQVRVGLHGSTKAFGIPTLHINNAGQLYKIRVTL